MSSEKFLYILVIYTLSDQVWWYKVVFELFQKLYTSANLCKPIHDVINYSTSICPFESGKCGKEGKKFRNVWISRERKELFRWNKVFL